MHRFYLIEYLINNFKIEKKTIEELKYELDKHIYYYGNHFKFPIEKQKFSIQKTINRKIKKHIVFLQAILGTALSQINKSTSKHKKKVLSNAYFSFNNKLKELDFNVYRPPWSISKQLTNIFPLNMLKDINYLKDSFETKSFVDLIDGLFINKILSFKTKLKKFAIKDEIKAIFVPNDISFFEKASIEVFKEIGRPSFIFLHGLPGVYNGVDDNRADYLLVWGEKIKQNHIAAGVNRKKIYVVGHPDYTTKINKFKKLRFSLENPLIITKSLPGAQPSTEVILHDRGNLILYLYMIQNVLQKFGVKKAFFRPHPSEDSKWYLKYIDKNFFVPDTRKLMVSLQESSVVIGPTSTVFLEAIYCGVNYVCFEPSYEGYDLINYKLVSPFDASDERVPVARDETQLKQILKEKILVDISVFEDYIKIPFDISFVKYLI